MRRIRAAALAAVFASAAAFGPAAAPPAKAQVMPTQGIDIPWFRSSTERAQREACRRNLPECRADVRAQMAFEESITVIVPWAALGAAILAVLFWLRKKEKARERKKKLARMRHTPGAFKTLDKPARKESDDGEADRLVF